MPAKQHLFMECNDCPELDASEELHNEDTQKHQSLIGQTQCTISIGHLDAHAAVMTSSSFCSTPKNCHLEHARRACSHLVKMEDDVIHMITNMPDLADLSDPDFDQTCSVQGDGKEIIPDNTPSLLGNHVTF